MEVKGTAVEILPKFVVKRFGKEYLNRWKDLLSEEAREEFSSGILSSRWYPLKSLLVDPTSRLGELLYGSDLIGALEIGRFSAEYALKGVYKLFVKLGSPETLIARASTILPTYYRPCAMEVVEVSSGRGTVRITDFAEMHPIIELRIKGWIEKALELSGCNNINVAIPRSLTNNDPYTELVARYE
jgi:hypothetical protein